jgi:methylated-DNA-[protein]-cysteine S-methyltransferase
VLLAEYRILRGSVSTYKLIAKHLGKQNGARAVGNALAANPFPVIVPCHRAIRSDRHLGGYQGGLAMKRALLYQESIQFDSAGRVICNHFHYEEKISDKGIQRTASRNRRC